MVVDHPAAAFSPVVRTTTPRILVVDDEEAVLVTVKGILELDGYEVVGTTSGQHALQLIGSERFDVVLTDLRLEGIQGIDLLREVARLSPDTASILFTGYGSLDSAVTAMREGAYDYLLKPCDILELRTTVSRALDRVAWRPSCAVGCASSS